MAQQSVSTLDVDIVDSIDAVDREEWNRFVEHADEGSIFHRAEWLDAIETGLGYPVLHLLLKKDTNLVGILPNVLREYERVPFTRLVSLEPGFGGPIITADESKALSLMIDELTESLEHHTLVHQIRATNTEYLGYNNLLKMHGYRPTRDGCRFEISLSKGYETIFEEMSSGRRRRIRRGRENDYRIVEDELTLSNLRRFHDKYAQVMDRVGGDAFPFSFLRALQQMESNVLLLSIRINDEYAGGVLELLDDDNNTIHGLISGVPEEFFEYNASELLYDRVIQWGIEQGYDTYDLGYTSSDVTDGLFKFKRSFGGEMVPNLSWERGCSPVWPLVRTGRELYWSRYKTPGEQ